MVTRGRRLKYVVDNRDEEGEREVMYVGYRHTADRKPGNERKAWSWCMP
jgi:hypothetical protein